MRRWLLLALVAAVLLTLHLTGATQLLSLETLRTHRAGLTAWVAANGALAALAYLALYAAAVAFSVPGAALLTLAGGFLFGAWAGAALTVLGATAGAVMVFLFARTLLGESALDRFGEAARRLAGNIRRNAWSYLLVLRLVPLFPFFLVNLVPAIAGVRLGTFAATTLVGIIPGTVVFSLAGSGLGTVLDQEGPVALGTILTPEIIAGLLGLALLALAAIPLRNRFAAAAPPPRLEEP